MEKYIIIDKIGEGSYGRVWRAVNSTSGEVVAIKRIKKRYDSWEECLKLIEVKTLRMMYHPNIVKLREVIRRSGILYFVFEYMDSNLLEVMQRRDRRFSEEEIKNFSLQVLRGLNHMHCRGYFHRDLKPANLLVSADVIKIADLGMAREIYPDLPLTEGVTTQWYRAPEVLLHSKNYNYKIDMWAVGAIMAEMFAFRPIFLGLSEIDQIDKICEVIGTPTEDCWPEGIALARVWNFKFQELGGTDFSTLLPSTSDEAIDLIKRLCSWDPADRPTALDALQHPFFRSSCYKFVIYKSPASVLEHCGTNRETMVEVLNCNLSCSECSTSIESAEAQVATTNKGDCLKKNGDTPTSFIDRCGTNNFIEGLSYNFSRLKFPNASVGIQAAAITDKGDNYLMNRDISASVFERCGTKNSTMKGLSYNFSRLKFPTASAGTQAANGDIFNSVKVSGLFRVEGDYFKSHDVKVCALKSYKDFLTPVDEMANPISLN